MNYSEIRGNHNTVNQTVTIGPAGKNCAHCGSGDIQSCAVAVALGTIVVRDNHGNEATSYSPFAQAARKIDGSEDQGWKIIMCWFFAFAGIMASISVSPLFMFQSAVSILIWFVFAEQWKQKGRMVDEEYSRTWICKSCGGRTIF